MVKKKTFMLPHTESSQLKNVQTLIFPCAIFANSRRSGIQHSRLGTCSQVEARYNFFITPTCSDLDGREKKTQTYTMLFFQSFSTASATSDPKFFAHFE